MTWDVIVRLLNITGCAVSLFYLSTAARKQWSSWNFKTQDHWWALVGWVFLGLEGTIESLIRNIVPGPRTIIQTLVVAWTLRALTRKGELKSQAAFPWKDKENDV